MSVDLFGTSFPDRRHPPRRVRQGKRRHRALFTPYHHLQACQTSMNTMMLGTTGAKTAILSAAPSLIFLFTCIVNHTERLVTLCWFLTSYSITVFHSKQYKSSVKVFILVELNV